MYKLMYAILKPMQRVLELLGGESCLDHSTIVGRYSPMHNYEKTISYLVQ